MRPLAEGYGPNHPQLLRRFAAMPHTLVHFDYRADNLFFDDVGDVVVIDFQAISKGGGAADVGYLLSQNLASDVRREHEDELLHTYHDTLLANGVRGYEFDQLAADYRVGVVYGFVIPVFAVGSLDASSERAMALWTAVLERVQDAIGQHDAHSLLDL
jgi:thiamine kinase-like enzyme